MKRFKQCFGLERLIIAICIVFASLFSPWMHNVFADTDGVGTFSFGTKAGLFYMPDVDAFMATYTSGSKKTTYTISGKASKGLFPYIRMRITNGFGLEASYGYEAGDELSLQTISASAVYMFREAGFRPYIKGGIVSGKFDYDILPGSFDRGTGWQAGGGFEAGGERAAFAMDLLYRNLINIIKLLARQQIPLIK